MTPPSRRLNEMLVLRATSPPDAVAAFITISPNFYAVLNSTTTDELGERLATLQNDPSALSKVILAFSFLTCRIALTSARLWNLRAVNQP
jgi:hypothetical protein